MNRSTWREALLGEVVSLQRGFDITKKEQRYGPYPVVSSSGYTSTHDQFKVTGPGVVVGRKGSLGGVYFSDRAFWPHDTTLWVKDFKGNVPRFVYYWLQTLGLSRFDVGASNPTLNRNHLHLLPVRVPDVLTQTVISLTLTSYDDLIENNARRIAILEEMAQAIYRQWFIEFRYPGHESVPLVASELGPIPTGWRVSAIGNVVSIDKGLSYKGAYLTEEGVPMANLKCFRPGGGFRRDATKPYSGEFKPKHVIRAGDVIVANTDLTQAGNVIGSPAIVPRHGFENGGIISHHLFVVRRENSDLNRSYVYQLLADGRFRSFARGTASGTTVLGFRTADLLAYPAVLPSPDLMRRYGAMADDLVDLAEDLEDANDNLRATRDFLIPRLISGEIDVSDLDIDVRDAAA